MKIQVNSSYEIISFASIGGLGNSIEISDDIVPYDFLLNFKPKKYKYEGGQILLNENYSSGNNEQPIQPPNISMPGSDEELRKMFAEMQVQLVQANMMVMQLSQQNARLSQEMVVINQKLEEVTNNEDVIPEV
ncbi:MAG TPA: DUF2977 domain-containing protein [Mammaliicoccus lentus]|nr:DUF2977 domain-containing protein [Mammaliicoccus lentus]HJF22792.1 DUF2977 domain-containing protein [Mammaliicoccus lentus]